jgi:hypothetical protein
MGVILTMLEDDAFALNRGAVMLPAINGEPR